MEIYLKLVLMATELIYSVIVVVLFCKLSIVYFESFLTFMFNQKNLIYDKIIEKPRLLFHLIGFLFIGFSFLVLYQISIDTNIYLTICLFLSSLALYFVGVFCGYITWTTIFTDKYIPIIEEMMKEKYELRIKEGIDVEQYVQKLIDSESINPLSQENLKLFLQNNPLESTIIWTAKTSRSKQVSYRALFDFLDQVVDGGFLAKKTPRKVYLSMVTDNFIIEGVEFKSNTPVRYSEWFYARVKQS